MKGQELFVLLVFLWQPEGSVRSVNLNSSSYGLQSQSVRKPAFGKNLIPCHSSTPSDWLLGFVSATPVFAVLCSDWLRSLLNCNPALQRICAVYTLRCLLFSMVSSLRLLQSLPRVLIFSVIFWDIKLATFSSNDTRSPSSMLTTELAMWCLRFCVCSEFVTNDFPSAPDMFPTKIHSNYGSIGQK